MKWCKPHNRFHSEATCPKCEDRVVKEAGRLPLRVTEPQEHPRCHRCWNLIARDREGNRICKCDGDVDMPSDLPSLLLGKS